MIKWIKYWYKWCFKRNELRRELYHKRLNRAGKRGSEAGVNAAKLVHEAFKDFGVTVEEFEKRLGIHGGRD